MRSKLGQEGGEVIEATADATATTSRDALAAVKRACGGLTMSITPKRRSRFSTLETLYVQLAKITHASRICRAWPTPPLAGRGWQPLWAHSGGAQRKT